MSVRELIALSDGPDQGLAVASDGLFFVSSVVGVPAGAGDSDAGGAGAVGAGAVGVRGLDIVFLCFGVSGSTKGPF